MISMYKIVNIKNTLLLTVIVVIIGSLGIVLDNSKSKIEAPVNVAEKFVRDIYTVDTKKVAEFKTLPAMPNRLSIGLGVTEVSAMEPSKEYIKTLHSLDKNIQPLMTEKGYQTITANTFNLLITRICAKGNYTAQITDFTLGKNVYGENEDTVRYPYEVKLKFISSDGKNEQADVSTGAIELLKENGQWKVSIYTITTFPKLYK